MKSLACSKLSELNLRLFSELGVDDLEEIDSVDFNALKSIEDLKRTVLRQHAKY